MQRVGGQTGDGVGEAPVRAHDGADVVAVEEQEHPGLGLPDELDRRIVEGQTAQGAEQFQVRRGAVHLQLQRLATAIPARVHRHHLHRIGSFGQSGQREHGLGGRGENGADRHVVEERLEGAVLAIAHRRHQTSRIGVDEHTALDHRVGPPHRFIDVGAGQHDRSSVLVGHHFLVEEVVRVEPGAGLIARADGDTQAQVRAIRLRQVHFQDVRGQAELARLRLAHHGAERDEVGLARQQAREGHPLAHAVARSGIWNLRHGRAVEAHHADRGGGLVAAHLVGHDHVAVRPEVVVVVEQHHNLAVAHGIQPQVGRSGRRRAVAHRDGFGGGLHHDARPGRADHEHEVVAARHQPFRHLYTRRAEGVQSIHQLPAQALPGLQVGLADQRDRHHAAGGRMRNLPRDVIEVLRLTRHGGEGEGLHRRHKAKLIEAEGLPARRGQQPGPALLGLDAQSHGLRLRHVPRVGGGVILGVVEPFRRQELDDVVRAIRPGQRYRRGGVGVSQRADVHRPARVGGQVQLGGHGRIQHVGQAEHAGRGLIEVGGREGDLPVGRDLPRIGHPGGFHQHVQGVTHLPRVVRCLRDHVVHHVAHQVGPVDHRAGIAILNLQQVVTGLREHGIRHAGHRARRHVLEPAHGQGRIARGDPGGAVATVGHAEVPPAYVERVGHQVEVRGGRMVEGVPVGARVIELQGHRGAVRTIDRDVVTDGGEIEAGLLGRRDGQFHLEHAPPDAGQLEGEGVRGAALVPGRQLGQREGWLGDPIHLQRQRVGGGEHPVAPRIRRGVHADVQGRGAELVGDQHGRRDHLACGVADHDPVGARHARRAQQPRSGVAQGDGAAHDIRRGRQHGQHRVHRARRIQRQHVRLHRPLGHGMPPAGVRARHFGQHVDYVVVGLVIRVAPRALEHQRDRHAVRTVQGTRLGCAAQRDHHLAAGHVVRGQAEVRAQAGVHQAFQQAADIIGGTHGTGLAMPVRRDAPARQFVARFHHGIELPSALDEHRVPVVPPAVQLQRIGSASRAIDGHLLAVAGDGEQEAGHPAVAGRRGQVHHRARRIGDQHVLHHVIHGESGGQPVEFHRRIAGHIGAHIRVRVGVDPVPIDEVPDADLVQVQHHVGLLLGRQIKHVAGPGIRIVVHQGDRRGAAGMGDGVARIRPEVARGRGFVGRVYRVVIRRLDGQVGRDQAAHLDQRVPFRLHIHGDGVAPLFAEEVADIVPRILRRIRDCRHHFLRRIRNRLRGFGRRLRRLLRRRRHRFRDPLRRFDRSLGGLGNRFAHIPVGLGGQFANRVEGGLRESADLHGKLVHHLAKLDQSLADLLEDGESVHRESEGLFPVAVPDLDRDADDAARDRGLVLVRVDVHVVEFDPAHQRHVIRYFHSHIEFAAEPLVLPVVGQQFAHDGAQDVYVALKLEPAVGVARMTAGIPDQHELGRPDIQQPVDICLPGGLQVVSRHAQGEVRVEEAVAEQLRGQHVRYLPPGPHGERRPALVGQVLHPATEGGDLAAELRHLDLCPDQEGDALQLAFADREVQIEAVLLAQLGNGRPAAERVLGDRGVDAQGQARGVKASDLEVGLHAQAGHQVKALQADQDLVHVHLRAHASKEVEPGIHDALHAQPDVLPVLREDHGLGPDLHADAEVVQQRGVVAEDELHVELFQLEGPVIERGRARPSSVVLRVHGEAARTGDAFAAGARVHGQVVALHLQHEVGVEQHGLAFARDLVATRQLLLEGALDAQGLHLHVRIGGGHHDFLDGLRPVGRIIGDLEGVAQGQILQRIVIQMQRVGAQRAAFVHRHHDGHQLVADHADVARRDGAGPAALGYGEINDTLVHIGAEVAAHQGQALVTVHMQLAGQDLLDHALGERDGLRLHGHREDPGIAG